MFIVLLCLILSIVSYVNFQRSLYDRCEERISDILNYVDGRIDHDDLAECARTLNKSPAYLELQALADDVFTRFSIDDLYINHAELTEHGVRFVNILTAFLPEDYDAGLDRLYYLGSDVTSLYDAPTVRQFYNIERAGVLNFFEESSEYGLDYTGVLPLRDSAGRVFGILCLDLSVNEIHAVLRHYTLENVLLIVLLGAAFVLLFLIWMRSNVTQPIHLLEKSVVSFAKTSHGQRDPNLLEFHPPEIHTDNEVESLSHAVSQMSRDMKRYVEGILAAEGQMRVMQSHFTEMDALAHQDALTKLKNKAAYQEKLDALDARLARGETDFAILMVDLNYLKRVNDTYGHEHGDAYLIGASRQVCDVFVHSPVYRVGGDEFVVVLEGTDYANREVLREDLAQRFRTSSEDESLPPWERYSAALGMSDAAPEDPTAMAAFQRADQEMYRNKREMKAARTT